MVQSAANGGYSRSDHHPQSLNANFAAMSTAEKLSNWTRDLKLWPNVQSKKSNNNLCNGPVEDLEKMVPKQWWKTVFSDDLYLKTDGDVVEDVEITREEISLLEQNPSVRKVLEKGSDITSTFILI